MKRIFTLLAAAFAAMMLTACSTITPGVVGGNDGQDIRIFTTQNPEGAITTATIESAFSKAGFVIDGNNNMNSPFKPRFGKTFYETYHLFTVHSPKHVLALVKDYPSIGLLSPLSMSIYSNDEKKTMNISSLTLRGMSRITQIPMDNPDLISYAKFMEEALAKALPGGKFQKLNYTKVADMSQQLATTFEVKFEGDTVEDRLDFKDDFEAEFEGELEPIGFLFPGFIDLGSELSEAGYKAFEFYDTYSICKLDVIYPVHQDHPEAGAFAPCSYYIYKLKNDPIVHMGFPSVENWITATDIEDEKSLEPLIEAQQLIIDTVKEITE